MMGWSFSTDYDGVCAGMTWCRSRVIDGQRFMIAFMKLTFLFCHSFLYSIPCIVFSNTYVQVNAKGIPLAPRDGPIFTKPSLPRRLINLLKHISIVIASYDLKCLVLLLRKTITIGSNFTALVSVTISCTLYLKWSIFLQLDCSGETLFASHKGIERKTRTCCYHDLGLELGKVSWKFEASYLDPFFYHCSDPRKATEGGHVTYFKFLPLSPYIKRAPYLSKSLPGIMVPYYEFT